MIEQYFRPGVRFLWTKPNDAVGPTDGSIVPSVMLANPMSYDGLDGHAAVVDPALLAAHAAAVLGLAMGAPVPHVWLDYAPGRTAQRPVGGGDILTGYMSGCLIVRGTFGGVPSALHVGTIDGQPAINQVVKRQLAQQLPADATAFNPAGAWTPGEIGTLQNRLGGAPVAAANVLALVTAAGVFHSILMFNVAVNQAWNNPAGRRYWCVGGRNQVAAMSRVQLMAKLLS